MAELVRRGHDSVVVAGDTTSGCVRASVVDAYSNGFHAAVVEDAVFDRSWLSHCVSLFDLHHTYADVLRTPTALQLLEQVAGEGGEASVMSGSTGRPRRTAPIPYRSARVRCGWHLPGGAQLAVWVINKVEFFPLARSILVIVWNLLEDPTRRYHDLGPEYYDTRLGPERRKRNHIRQLEALGYTVTLKPAA